MASLTQLENFEQAVHTMCPTVVIKTDGEALRLLTPIPTDVFAAKVFNRYMRHLGRVYDLYYAGPDGQGFPFFLNEED